MLSLSLPLFFPRLDHKQEEAVFFSGNVGGSLLKALGSCKNQVRYEGFFPISVRYKIKVSRNLKLWLNQSISFWCVFFPVYFYVRNNNNNSETPHIRAGKSHKPPPAGKSRERKARDFFLGGIPFHCFCWYKIRVCGKWKGGGEGCLKGFFSENAFLIFFHVRNFISDHNLGFFRAKTFFYGKSFEQHIHIRRSYGSNSIYRRGIWEIFFFLDGDWCLRPMGRTDGFWARGGRLFLSTAQCPKGKLNHPSNPSLLRFSPQSDNRGGGGGGGTFSEFSVSLMPVMCCLYTKKNTSVLYILFVLSNPHVLKTRLENVPT